MVDVSYTCDLQTASLLFDRHLTVDICETQTHLFDAVRNSLAGRRFVAQSTFIVWLPRRLRQAVVLLPHRMRHPWPCAANIQGRWDIQQTIQLQVERAIVVAFAQLTADNRKPMANCC